MKNWKKLLLILLLAGLAAGTYGFYLYFKKPADVRTLAPDYSVTAVALLEEFNKDETTANTKYLNKVLAVKGSIQEIKIDSSTGQATLILSTGDPMSAITCSFYDNEADQVRKLKSGSIVVIKGKYTGKLMDIILNKCSVDK